MGAIKREPTPAGPVTDLFDRLHDSTWRQVSLRCGRSRPGSDAVSSVVDRPQHVPRSAGAEVGLSRAGRRGTRRRCSGVPSGYGKRPGWPRRQRTTPGDRGGGQRRVSGRPAGVGCLGQQPALTAPTGNAGHRDATADLVQRDSAAQSALHRPGRRTGGDCGPISPGTTGRIRRPAHLRHGRRW